MGWRCRNVWICWNTYMCSTSYWINYVYKVDVKVEEENKTILLLTLFPDSYDNLMTPLLFRKDTVNLEDVTISLISNEIRMRSNLEGDQDFRLISWVDNCKGRSSMRGFANSWSKSKSRGNDKMQCFHYKKYDHIKRACTECADRKKNDILSTTLIEE